MPCCCCVAGRQWMLRPWPCWCGTCSAHSAGLESSHNGGLLCCSSRWQCSRTTSHPCGQEGSKPQGTQALLSTRSARRPWPTHTSCRLICELCQHPWQRQVRFFWKHGQVSLWMWKVFRRLPTFNQHVLQMGGGSKMKRLLPSYRSGENRKASAEMAPPCRTDPF